MKHFLSFLFILVVTCSYSQPEVRLYTGLSSATNENKNISPKDNFQTGIHYGIDFIVSEQALSPFLGLQYHSRDIVATPSIFKLKKEEEKVSFLKARLGINSPIGDIGDVITLHGRALFMINKVLSLNNSFVEARGHGALNEYATSWGVGMGFQLYAISIDFEYEKHLADSYKDSGDSKFTVYNIAIGIRI